MMSMTLVGWLMRMILRLFLHSLRFPYSVHQRLGPLLWSLFFLLPQIFWVSAISGAIVASHPFFYQTGSDIVNYWKFSCIQTANCLLHIYFKYGQAFVVSFSFVRVRRLGWSFDDRIQISWKATEGSDTYNVQRNKLCMNTFLKDHVNLSQFHAERNAKERFQQGTRKLHLSKEGNQLHVILL
ncbi:hypothetical protein DPMN_174747 [Dreissena polymorpha]|uniref:Uncharacterized protein n=1 Tax=Dreissena polymorpha TaxID=45954 RepID=A0A9D4IIV7_DREPO|nr:hypothetical protein DPMN_174747 [Dreissena polymorpha]